MDGGKIPYRFSTKSVNRFIPIIENLLASWPQPIRVNSGELGHETYRGRFRDAIKAILLYGASYPKLAERLEAIGGLSAITVVDSNGFLTIGPRTILRTRAQKVLSPGEVVAGLVTIGDSVVPKGKEVDVLRACILLLESGILTNIELTGVTEELAWSCIDDSSPVEVMSTEPNKITLY